MMSGGAGKDASARLRVSAVQYLNARPLYEGLDREPASGRIRLDLALPSEVARRVAEDEADIALMPVAAAATIGDLRVVRGIGIGARGPVRTVLLASEVPIEDLTHVSLDLSSRTSVILARLILRAKRGGAEPHLLGATSKDAVVGVGGTRGAVVIGDPAFDVEGRYKHTIDLAEAWYELTGLPFVFAAWFGRKGGLAEEDEALLVQAKEHGLGERTRIAGDYARGSGKSLASIESYLRHSITFDLGEEERRALVRFYDEAAKAKLLPPASIRFFDEDRKRHAVPISLDTVLSRAADGERLSATEGERILEEASLFDIGLAADSVRRRKHPNDVVTYIVDRNVNYTNVCTTSCRFCAFYRPPGHAEGYVLSREVLGQKLQEVVDANGVQILLQGGLNPELPITWYEDLFRWIKSEYHLGLHALSPEEIIHLSQLESLPIPTVLARLHQAGMDSLPGGGAEILVDRVRRVIAKTKCTSDEWLGVMREAHRMGLRSSATMMYGTVDTPRDRINHLVKIRDLQDEMGGFTAFFCWDFQYEKGTRIRPSETGTVLYLRQQGVSRLMLDNVDHVGASWVTQGPEVGQVALRFGADDFGSVMFEENVVSSAGTTYCINAEAIEHRIRAAGFRAVRRNVRYDWLNEPS